MALGHPIGATGAILIGTPLDELERRDLRRGDAGHHRNLGLFRQSVKTTEAGGPRGYDAGKKIKPVLSDCRRQAVEGGRKPHIVTDTIGNMLDGLVHPADIQDRDGAPGLIERRCDAYPLLARFFADGGHAGQKLETAIAHVDRRAIEIIKRSGAPGFVLLLPRR